LTNLEKELWPGEFTKRDFITYMYSVAEYVLPHFADRPIVMTRYPDGIDGKSFYQKDLPEHAPEFIPTFPYRTEEGRTVNFALCEEPATLVWMANMAALELHPWFSRTAAPDRPDFLAFDLDPAEPVGFDEVREVCFMVKTLLDEVGLQSWPKTSGATGLHIYVPIIPEFTYDEVRAVARKLAEALLALRPGLITLERSVARRTGKVYIDYLQLIKGKTLVGVYMPRPRRGAPVSAPFLWSELDRLRPEDFTMTSMPPRLAAHGDLFVPPTGESQSLRSLVRRFVD
jgi:bifunctional non-homologous end joining protein LigD